jgi:site-specific DNA-methyltransferase (adenine-specific)
LRDYNGYTFDFEGIANELYRITKKGGVVVWVVGDATIKGSETGTSFRQALYFKEIGFNLHDTMLYKTNKIPLNHNRYEQEFEYMFILSKGKPKTFNPIRIPCKYAGTATSGTFRHTGKELAKAHTIKPISETKIKGNVWELASGNMKGTLDKIAFQHPATFPEKLAEDHILSWSNEGDTVLDPMAGSGTTLKMAKKNNRKFIGIEISKEYCKIAKKRINN